AGGDARPTADARSRVKPGIRCLFWNQDRIGIGRASGGRADETSRLNDPVERRPIHDQIAYNREGAGAPRLECKSLAILILEEAHRELTHGSATLASMGHAADQK